MVADDDIDRQCAALMRSAQDGDRAAYAGLLRDIVPLLRGAVRRRRRSLQPQDVEDLVQDILLSLHAVRATYDPERPFLPWLMAIARNRIADGARRYTRQTANEVAVEHLPETFSEDEANMGAGGLPRSGGLEESHSGSAPRAAPGRRDAEAPGNVAQGGRHGQWHERQRSQSIGASSRFGRR